MPTLRGFSIDTFNSFRKEMGLLYTHDFHIVIPWPTALIDDTGNLKPIQQNMELIADSINLPETGEVTWGVQRYSYGAIETRPLIPKFSPLQATFICDQYADVQKFFIDWVRLIVNYVFGETSPNGAETYEISYREDYTVDMHLHIYNTFGEQVREMVFRDAYPISVGDVLLSWGRQNEYLKLPVTFSFTDMQVIQ